MPIRDRVSRLRDNFMVKVSSSAAVKCGMLIIDNLQHTDVE